MQLTITIKDGATNRDIASQLRWQANLIEGMEPKAAASRTNTESVSTAQTESDDEDFAKTSKTSKKAAAKAAATSFEDDADEQEPELSNEAVEMKDEVDDEDFMETAPKAKKGKKLTVNDVNDACKAKAQSSDRKTVLGILKKKFNVTSVTELKPEQFADVIKAMAV